MPVKSPYNFVPAVDENEVFKPDWAHQINHDIPFSDGESGEIEIKITAETPIFIRNGHSKNDQDNDFSNIEIDGKKKYFVPGSSLKGMFRNVLEIMAKSRLNKNLVNNDRYSFRDLSSANSEYMRSYDTNQVKGGWLKEESDGSWKIEECPQIAHIHHSEVDKALGLAERDGFRLMFLNKDPTHKSAEFKYGHCDKNRKVLRHKFRTDDHEQKVKANLDPNGEWGTIIFTGQPGKRNEPLGRRPSGKVHEFVFFESDEPNLITITKDQQKDFKFIYLDHDRNNISKDWKYWRSKLERGGKVPVFFNKEGGDKVKHFGLSYMYKLPYKHSVHQMLPLSQYDQSEKDMTEVIFGHIDKDDALKGRLFVGHAFSDNAEPTNNTIREILASPKASFFPYYIKQDGSDYESYQKVGSALRGYKRYPVTKDERKGEYGQKQQNNPNIFTSFIPLHKGSVFHSKIRFHNLKKIEIGAVLSSITFHNMDHCYHSLGGVKSFGYGKVKVQIVKLQHLEYQLEEYLYAFEAAMGDGWYNNTSMRELISMASNTNNDSLHYPELTEYVKIKKDPGQALPSFSSLNQPVLNSVKLKMDKKQQEMEHERARQEKLENERLEQKQAERLKGSQDRHEIETFIRDYPSNIHLAELRLRIDELRDSEKKQEADKIRDQSLIFYSYLFTDIKSILNNLLKRNKHLVFSDKQQLQIMAALKQCWVEDQSTFYKKKVLATINQFPWTDIRKWLSNERMNSLYRELTESL